MAYMMPIMKKNYSLYGAGAGAGAANRQRKTSDHTETDRRKIQSNGARRQVKSAGPSVPSSPGHVTSTEAFRGTHNNSVGMRSRGSAPTFLSPHPNRPKLQHTYAITVLYYRD